MAIAKTLSQEADLRPPHFSFRFRRPGPVLLLFPALAAIVAVSLYPVILGLWLSFRNTTLASPEDAFIGVANYQQLLADSQFWNAWVHTIEFTTASTMLETAIGLLMALVLTERFFGRGMVRAAMLVPWAIPTVVSSKMFGWLFDGQHGAVNYLLRSIGVIQHHVNWYGSPDLALPTIYFRTIPQTIDEAARIDGANPLTIFFRITIPMSLPGVVTTGLLCFIAAWNEFMFALAFTSDINHQTVPVGIANFTDLHYVPWGDIAAASVVVTLPLIVLVLIFERHIIAGLTGGAVKE
jgi:trehalose/maltose transport system permease protein